MAHGQPDYVRETIVNLSDISLSKLDLLTTVITRAQLIYLGGQANYYDTANNKAFFPANYDFPPTTAPEETYQEFTAAQYVNLSIINNSYSIKSINFGSRASVLFRVSKLAGVLDNNPFLIFVRGYVHRLLPPGDPIIYIYIWNSTTSTWDVFGENIPYDGQWHDLTLSISDGTNYFDANDYIYILAVCDLVFTISGNFYVCIDNLYIDFASAYYNKVKVYV